MKSRAALIALILFISASTTGQFILLKKYRSFKTVKFSRGDSITYKLKDKNAKWKYGHIGIIGDNYFMTENDSIPIDQISAIKIPREGLHFRSDGKMLIIGGLFFSSISVINDLINHSAIIFTKGQAISYSALLITGFILLNLPNKVCVINKRYTLRVYKEFPYNLQKPVKYIPSYKL
jgi:hypothetical protein